MKIWDIMKLLLAVAIVILIFRFIINEKFFGPMSFEFFAIVALSIVSIIVYVVMKYYNIIKVTSKAKSHYDSLEAIVHDVLSHGGHIPAELDDKAGLILHPDFDWDISVGIGPLMQDHFVRFKDSDGSWRSIFYDASLGVIRGEIKGDPLGGRRSDVVKEAVAINKRLKTGEASIISITPGMIEKQTIISNTPKDSKPDEDVKV